MLPCSHEVDYPDCDNSKMFANENITNCETREKRLKENCEKPSEGVFRYFNDRFGRKKGNLYGYNIDCKKNFINIAIFIINWLEFYPRIISEELTNESNYQIKSQSSSFFGTKPKISPEPPKIEGNNKYYKEKYLKYKTKYINLKNNSFNK